MVQFELKTHENGMKYFLFLPQNAPIVQDSTSQGSKHSFPLILCLHDYGAINNEEKVRGAGLVKRLCNDNHFAETFPFMVLAPIAAQKNWEKCFDKLVPVLDFVMSHESVDHDKLYLTGFSMGGHGALRLATLFPSRFAAVVPVCSYLDKSNKNKIKTQANGGHHIPQAVSALSSMPMWFFHGANDAVVPVTFSDVIVEKLRQAGNQTVKFTRYENSPPMIVNGKSFEGHACYDVCYSDEALYEWLLQQRRATS